MPSPRAAPFLPLFLRELRVLLSRWHLWAALAAVALVQAALFFGAAPLEGAQPALVVALAAAWCCALPLVIACGACEDRGAGAALLMQLGHGPTRQGAARLGAALLGALVLSLPTLGTLGLLVAKGAAPSPGAVTLALLLLVAALGGAAALWLAALLEDTGFTALATLLLSAAALWLDARGGLEVLRAAREGAVSISSLAALAVLAGAVFVLAALQASPVASGERVVVRSLLTLAVGGALLAVASRVPGRLGELAALDVKARAAQATSLGELRGAALALGGAVFVVALILAWRRRA
ncbi:MAG: hypothetical protein IT382_17910 [Deltaproteobacteria bacterium]|nr:hypothetical protein [Deltaproteobacteria bacterium]